MDSKLTRCHVNKLLLEDVMKFNMQLYLILDITKKFY